MDLLDNFPSRETRKRIGARGEWRVGSTRVGTDSDRCAAKSDT